MATSTLDPIYYHAPTYARAVVQVSLYDISYFNSPVSIHHVPFLFFLHPALPLPYPIIVHPKSSNSSADSLMHTAKQQGAKSTFSRNALPFTERNTYDDAIGASFSSKKNKRALCPSQRGSSALDTDLETCKAVLAAPLPLLSAQLSDYVSGLFSSLCMPYLLLVLRAELRNLTVVFIEPLRLILIQIKSRRQPQC